MTTAPALADGVTRLAACDVRVSDRHWSFQRDNADAIARHFRAAVRNTPEFYNGRVFVMVEGVLSGDRLAGTLAPTDFASYLYWRDSGFDTGHGRDLFGKAVIEAADGGLLLGRAAAHTMNAGRADLIGGFVDPIDVGFDGAVDVDATIAREVVEETGLSMDELDREPGFLLCIEGALVAICAHYRSRLPAAALVAEITATLAAEGKPELADIVIVARAQRQDRAALDALGVPSYAARLIGALAGLRAL